MPIGDCFKSRHLYNVLVLKLPIRTNIDFYSDLCYYGLDSFVHGFECDYPM